MILEAGQIQEITTAAFVVHVGAGSLALISGTVAIAAPKGERLHRTAGTVFFVSMLVMAMFAAYLAIAMPDQLVNVFIAVLTSYLVATAWLTVKRKEGAIGAFERLALVVALLLCAPFAILSFQLASGLPPLFKSAVPFEGPVLIAVYVFTGLLLIAVISDAKVVLRGGISGAPRIARHLWRMCLGLTLAAGSAFTNGAARLLPGPYHVPLVFFLPQFVPLLLLFYWMVRVRLTGWYKERAATQAA